MKGKALLVVAGLLIGAPEVFAQESFRLSLAETQAFHECMYAAWVDNYCRDRTLWFLPNYHRWFLTCVDANGGGKYPIDGRRNWVSAEDYCRSGLRTRAR